MNLKKLSVAFLIPTMMGVSALTALAEDVTNALVGVQGYDLVSYQTGKLPQKGIGYYISDYKGVTYEFANEANKKTFDANPSKYVPAFNGYCAYGVSVNKKFIGDPQVFEVYNGKLYLNLSQEIRDTWIKDVPGYVKTANENWPGIVNKSPNSL
ncbi:MAG: YHS domain protein [Cyanobacteria bacterium]|nr:YHS domain protein [Cyanobacteriota bacterium]